MEITVEPRTKFLSTVDWFVFSIQPLIRLSINKIAVEGNFKTSTVVFETDLQALLNSATLFNESNLM